MVATPMSRRATPLEHLLHTAAVMPPYSESAYDQNLHDLIALILQRVILPSVTMTWGRISVGILALLALGFLH